MNLNPEAIRIETLFDSVEKELVRRWGSHNVPPSFINRPVLHLRVLVKAWWHLYHESSCARQGLDRMLWKRSSFLSTGALDTPRLGASLKEIHRLIDQEALRSFRALTKGEESSISLLTLITQYYLDECVIDSVFGPREEI